MSTEAPDDALDAIMSERRQLINLSYRLLGSLAEAEDVAQETYARWYAMTPQQRTEIDVPGAWLTTVASRICLDLLGSARVRRERYVGEWIPEPLPGRGDWHPTNSTGVADPADRVSLDESISMAILVVLDSLTPAERVAFVLHDVFQYSFAEVAEIVGRTPGACRQLASSARSRIRSARVPSLPTTKQRQIVDEFRRAWQAQDIAGLIGLLDPNATTIADGGGIVSAVLHPIVGAELVAEGFADLARRANGLRLSERTVNGQPGLVAEQDGKVIVVLAFEIVAGRIRTIWAIRNPEKLRAWTPPSLDEP